MDIRIKELKLKNTEYNIPHSISNTIQNNMLKLCYIVVYNA